MATVSEQQAAPSGNGWVGEHGGNGNSKVA
jgi:hypothetical protein